MWTMYGCYNIAIHVTCDTSSILIKARCEIMLYITVTTIRYTYINTVMNNCKINLVLNMYYLQNYKRNYGIFFLF